MRRAAAWVFIACAICTPSITNADQALTDEEASVVMKLCALGRTEAVSTDVEAELLKILRSASIEISVALRDVGAILEKIEPDSVGLDFYREYLSCVNSERERSMEIDNFRSLLDDALERLKDSSGALDIYFNDQNYAVIRPTIARGLVTEINFLNSNCAFYSWVDGVFFKERGPHVIGAVIPEYAAYVNVFPTQINLNRDNDELMDRAYLRTTVFPADENLLASHYLADHDQVRVNLVVRSLDRAKCLLSYSIFQQEVDDE